MKKLLIFLILNTLYFTLYTPKVLSQDFRNDYQVEYFLSEDKKQINTKVKFTVSITNFRSDLYVKKFSLGFPKSFTIRDLKAYDDFIALTPQSTISDEVTKIDLEFSQPRVGKNTVNNLYLEFYQDNLFNINGNIWEVIIPTISEKNNSSYKILVHLPTGSEKKISIAKPKPDTVLADTIIWNNPKTKTVYAVFGNKQYYKTQLTYKLKNSKFVPVYTDIAFPPDTLYQQIYLKSIDPPPVDVKTDEDGNYLGRYYLKPRQTKTILYNATIVVYPQVRKELIDPTRLRLLKQKKYLLAETQYWSLPQDRTIKSIQPKIKDIYYFVSNTLQYNYSKVNSNNIRLGAKQALKKPSQAVCMEFTDLFIALARAKGIYTREIQGYGFSQDPKLRPLSLVFDILHSWPEYYDTKSQLWLPVDPTWENTSGIDYFSSFDLNHITFVIHGKNDDYPKAAGTYKIEDSRDVSISTTDQPPSLKTNFTLKIDKLEVKINDRASYQAKLTVTNLGNAYIWDKPIPILVRNLEVSPQNISLSPLAPYEKRTVSFTYRAKVNDISKLGYISIKFPQNDFSANIAILPFYYALALKLSFFLFLILTLLFFYLFILKRLKSPKIK